MYSATSDLDTISSGAPYPSCVPIPSDIEGHYSAQLVERVRQGETQSIEALCLMLDSWARRQLAQNVDPQLIEDKFHDVVVTVLEAISNGRVKHPDRLPGFVRTITRRNVTAHIRANIKGRRCTRFNEYDFPGTGEDSPEALVFRREKGEEIAALLNSLRPRDRNLLIQFYFYDRPPSQICAEMGLTPTQFRLQKSRALARCASAAGRLLPASQPSRRPSRRKLSAA